MPLPLQRLPLACCLRRRHRLLLLLLMQRRHGRHVLQVCVALRLGRRCRCGRRRRSSGREPLLVATLLHLVVVLESFRCRCCERRHVLRMSLVRQAQGAARAAVPIVHLQLHALHRITSSIACHPLALPIEVRLVVVVVVVVQQAVAVPCPLVLLLLLLLVQSGRCCSGCHGRLGGGCSRVLHTVLGVAVRVVVSVVISHSPCHVVHLHCPSL